MRNLDYPVDQACPHDGWYNGNPKLMIHNGTYADYRHRLVEWVAKKKMTEQDLNAYDKAWAAIPLSSKKERRLAVVEAIKKVPVKQRDGKVEYLSKPSDNGRGSLEDRKPALRRQLTQRQPLGSIDTRPDPLAMEEAAKLPQSELDTDSGQRGRSVPEFVAPKRTVALAAAV